MGQMRECKGVATRVWRDPEGVLRVQYHQTCVVAVYPDGSIELDTGGWKTATTKARMNQAAHQFNLGFRVYQHKHEWFVGWWDGRPSKAFDGRRIIIQRRPMRWTGDAWETFDAPWSVPFEPALPLR